MNATAKTGHLALALAAVLAAAPGAGTAGPLSAEAAIFQKVCLANAPALDPAGIAAAAGTVRYAGRSILVAGGVEYEPGRRCKVVFPVAGAPEDAEVAGLARAFAARVGGEVRLQRSAIGGDRWYEVRAGRQKWGIEGGARRGIRHFTIAKR